jgi:hypothetical protein
MQAALVAILMTGVVQANPLEKAETDGREVIAAGQLRAAGTSSGWLGHSAAVPQEAAHRGFASLSHQPPSSFHPAVQPRHDHGFVDSTVGSIWPLPQIRYSSRLGFRPEKRWNPNSPDGYYFHRTYNYRVEFDYPWHATPRAYRGFCQ